MVVTNWEKFSMVATNWEKFSMVATNWEKFNMVVINLVKIQYGGTQFGKNSGQWQPTGKIQYGSHQLGKKFSMVVPNWDFNQYGGAQLCLISRWCCLS